MRRIVSVIPILILLCTPLLCFAVQGNRGPTYGSAGSAPSPIDTLRYTLRSQQSELRMVQERLSGYEDQMDLLKEDLKRILDERNAQNTRIVEQLTLHLKDTDCHLNELKTDNATLRHDLAALVDHLKELHTLVEQLQANLQQQGKKSQLLEKTLSTLVQSLDLSSPATSQETGAHKVQAGETLEKIARKYGTSIRLLKEENQLETDRIRVGQTLKLPTSSPSPSSSSVSPP